METYKFECVKTRTYEIKPFGNFVFKWKKTNLYHERPDWVYIGECNINHPEGMPMSDAEEKRFISLMKKHKTDVFIDDCEYSPTFYTLTNSGMTPISHPRIRTLWVSELNKKNNGEEK